MRSACHSLPEDAGEYPENLLRLCIGPQVMTCSGVVWETVGLGIALLGHVQALLRYARHLGWAVPAVTLARRQRQAQPGRGPPGAPPATQVVTADQDHSDASFSTGSAHGCLRQLTLSISTADRRVNGSGPHEAERTSRMAQEATGARTKITA